MRNYLKFKGFSWLGLLALMVSLLLAACGDTTTPVSSVATPTTTAAPTTTTASPTTAAPVTTAPGSLPTVTAQPPTTAPVTTVAPVTTLAPVTTINDTTAPATETTQAPPTKDPDTKAPSQPGTTAAVTTASPTRPGIGDFSGSGALAYLDRGSLWIVNVGNKQKAMLFQATDKDTVVGKPDWAPGNKSIAFVSRRPTGESEIYTIGLDGNSGVASVGGTRGEPLTSNTDPKFSPDGRLIAFTRTFDTDKNGKFERSDKHEVWAMDASGQNSRKLADGQQPSWSPDSQRLAFVTNGKLVEGSTFPRNNALHLISVRGQNEWEPTSTAKMPDDLTSLGFPFGPDTAFIENPVWLDGGKAIAFTTIGHSGLVVTLNSTTGKDMKFWDASYEGGVASLQGQATRLAYQYNSPSGRPFVRTLDISGKPDLGKPDKEQIGSPRGQIAVYPALSASANTLAYFKATSPDALNGDFANATGSLVASSLFEGRLQGEQELVTGNIQALVWSK